SLFKPDSELSLLNRRGAIAAMPCSRDLYRVLKVSEEVYRGSSGAFDPTALRGRKAPGFARVRLDPERESAELRAPDLRIDLGGIGKGYALDAAARAMDGLGIKSALLNFGGQILAVGTPPGLDACAAPSRSSPRTPRAPTPGPPRSSCWASPRRLRPSAAAPSRLSAARSSPKRFRATST
ncbi:MAG: membrane-associated lipoprotein, partial [Elusimicrobia bacterium]